MVGVRWTPTRRTSSRWDSASTSTWVTPGTAVATSASTWRVARQGAQKAEENCSSVARSPSSVPRSDAVRRPGPSVGASVDRAVGAAADACEVGAASATGVGAASRTRWVPRKRPSVRARCAPKAVAATSTTTTTQSPTPMSRSSQRAGEHERVRDRSSWRTTRSVAPLLTNADIGGKRGGPSTWEEVDGPAVAVSWEELSAVVVRPPGRDDTCPTRRSEGGYARFDNFVGFSVGRAVRARDHAGCGPSGSWEEVHPARRHRRSDPQASGPRPPPGPPPHTANEPSQGPLRPPPAERSGVAPHKEGLLTHSHLWRHMRRRRRQVGGTARGGEGRRRPPSPLETRAFIPR